MAAITKYKSLGGFNKRSLFTHSSGDWNSKIKEPAKLGHSKACLLGLQVAVFTMCLFTSSSLCVSVQISSSYENISCVGLGPTHVTSFYPNYLVRNPISKWSQIQRHWGLGHQSINLRGHNSSHNSVSMFPDSFHTGTCNLILLILKGFSSFISSNSWTRIHWNICHWCRPV